MMPFDFVNHFGIQASIKELFKIEETREQPFQRQIVKPQEVKEEIPESVETLSGAGEPVPESSLFEQVSNNKPSTVLTPI